MKLIKKGKGPQPRIFRGTCRNCQDVYEEKEKNLNVTTDRDGEIAKAKCPNCKYEIFFYPKAK